MDQSLFTVMKLSHQEGVSRQCSNEFVEHLSSQLRNRSLTEEDVVSELRRLVGRPYADDYLGE